VYQHTDKSALYVKLAERLISVEPGIREYYNSQTGKPPATAAPIFGWTAAVFIDLTIQASLKTNSKPPTEFTRP